MKTRIIIFFALGMSIFTAGTWTLAFSVMVTGMYIHEPNIGIAIIELIFAATLTLLALLGFLLYSKQGVAPKE